MTREPDFPDDENGDVLRRMAAAGIDLVSPRVIDFEHCFPDEASARAFQRAVVETVLDAKLITPDPDADRGWEVQCKARMIPTHAAITQTELRLAKVAQGFGGFPDGWGSLSDPDGSPAE
ncbi:MAG TPA: ribonuclease E inhibitor RraB [Polyangiaceae bacterium]